MFRNSPSREHNRSEGTLSRGIRAKRYSVSTERVRSKSAAGIRSFPAR